MNELRAVHFAVTTNLNDTSIVNQKLSTELSELRKTLNEVKSYYILSLRIFILQFLFE